MVIQKLDLRPQEENVYSSLIGSILRQLEEDVRGFDYRMFSRDASLALARSYGDCRAASLANLLKYIVRRVSEIYESSQKLFCSTLLLEVETHNRLLVHTRSPFMPLEIGVAWHPYFNLPYIPASTLKGVLKAYMESYNKELCGLSAGDLLGTKESESRLVFFDAFPVSCKKALLEADVLTPHYPEVQGVVDEARVRPNPITFPVIADGVRFRFIVGIRNDSSSKILCIIKKLPELLKETFDRGLGAKTSIGYGTVRVFLGSHAGGEC